MSIKKLGVTVAVLLIAASAMASNFRGADQVYVPAVSHAQGASGVFLSDVWVSNLSDDQVSVSVIYQTGQLAALHSEVVKNNLFTLQPRERREFVDFLPQLGVTSGSGQVIFNACKANISCGPETQDANGVSPNYRNISVESRNYQIPSGSSLSQNPPTTGQLIAGIPWYNYVSEDQAANGLDRVFITGIRQTGGSGQAGTYRTNIALVNASQFANTHLVLSLFNGTGTQLGTDVDIPIAPLGTYQNRVDSIFGAAATGTNLWVQIVQRNSSVAEPSTTPAGCLPAAGSNGCPAFMAFGSVLDNQSGDATTLEAQYFKGLTDVQWQCIYPASGAAPCKGTTSRMRRTVRARLEEKSEGK